MKKTFLVLVLVVTAMMLKAQIRKTTTQQPTSTPTLTPPKRAIINATSDVVMLPTEGKDLGIAIDKMIDSSDITSTRYIVQYSVINSGTVDLDISNITVQGLFNKIGTGINTPSGGWMLTPALLNNNTILHPGESYQGKMNASTSLLFVEAPYKYVLTVDNGNRIAEANENNNTAELTMQPHKQPDLVPTSLQVIYNTQAGRWEISYVITNAGKNPIDLNVVNVQGYFDAVVPYGPPEGGCGRYVSNSSPATILNPNETFAATFICSQNNLHHGKEYNYSLTFTSFYSVPESNTINNKATIRVTAP